MGLRINDIAPNFTTNSTAGELTLHDWIGSYASFSNRLRLELTVDIENHSPLAQRMPEIPDFLRLAVPSTGEEIDLTYAYQEPSDDLRENSSEQFSIALSWTAESSSPDFSETDVELQLRERPWDGVAFGAPVVVTITGP